MIEIATTVLLLTSAFSAPKEAIAETVKNQQFVIAKEEVTAHSITLDGYVQSYFKDIPLLAEIAECESSVRQYDSKGNVLRGRVNSGDIGIMQINKYYHEDKAKELGLDIYTIDGNLAFAKWLYEKYGNTPWSSSSKCWKARELVMK